MRFKSTRATTTTSSSSSSVSFEEAVFEGLAPDGGLYIPDTIPKLDLKEILSWQNNMSFTQIAYKILSLYITDEEIPSNDLKNILEKSFESFTHPDIVPLVKLPNIIDDDDDGMKKMYALELFHGPTFAFKDVALQLLGNLFEYFLIRKSNHNHSNNNNKNNDKTPPYITVLGATSGDTGGAAIYGLRGKKNIQVIILHPYNRISPIQELQMTTIHDENVHNIALQDATFDDCQEIVKNLFGNLEFKQKTHLAAINSINVARILAQIIYYFTSYLSLLKQNGIIVDSNGIITSSSTYMNNHHQHHHHDDDDEKEKLPKIQFSVPTGNFGDILAGYYALRMGLPIHKLIVATNENDILTRFFESGTYAKLCPNQNTSPPSSLSSVEVKQTLSPAMDILVSSNFERLLWYLARDDDDENNNNEKDLIASTKVSEWMNQLKSQGYFSVSKKELDLGRKTFDAVRTSNIQTSNIMKMYYNNNHPSSCLLDPHSAVGIHAARVIIKNNHLNHQKSSSSSSLVLYTICLAPAHPAKFPETVKQAINDNNNNDKKISFDDYAPKPLKDLRGLEKRMTIIKAGGLGKILVSNGTLQVRDIIEKVAKLQSQQL